METIKSIEERAKEAYPAHEYSVLERVMKRGAYIRGAKEQKAIDEEVRLKKSDDMTKAEYDRETAFADWYLKNGKGTPTYSDAIEWARKQTIDEVCEWMMNFKNAAGEFPLYDYVGNFRKAMEEQDMNWLRKLFKKKKTLRDKVVEMYGEEAGVYYDNLSQGIPIGGLFKTAVFIDMVEEARRLLEEEKQLWKRWKEQL